MNNYICRSNAVENAKNGKGVITNDGYVYIDQQIKYTIIGDQHKYHTEANVPTVDILGYIRQDDEVDTSLVYLEGSVPDATPIVKIYGQKTVDGLGKHKFIKIVRNAIIVDRKIKKLRKK